MDIQALKSRRSEIENFFSNAINAISLFLLSSNSLTQYLQGPFNHNTEPVKISQNKLLNLIKKQEAIRAVLEDAADLQLSSKSDQHWMRELMDIVYLIDDVVDEFQFRALLFTRFREFDNSLHECAGKKKTQAKDLLSSAPSGSLADKIELIRDRFREIAYDRNALQLREEDGAKIAKPSIVTPSSSQTASNLIGRDHDMEKLIRLLQSDEESNNVYSVISICGMAGVGKTTLVQYICQNQSIKSSFNPTIWVCVSQIFNVVEISHEIVKCIEKDEHYCNSCDLENLHDTVVGHLRGKKFLLVIDDLWDKAADNWDSLLAPLKHGARGSKVIVTTRSMQIGRMICPKRYHLNCLSDDYCWTIFRERAFQRCDSKLDPELEKIGRKIVARCKGLPLAAMAIGVTLNNSHKKKDWNEVLNNFLTEDAVVKKILPALRVTYEFLSLNLKQCFAYCSLFPKGYVYRKDMLVQLWMAQGFISTTRSSDLEFVGSKYFVDLLDRCFFQHLPSYYPGEDRYLMHDLYHELAQVVSVKEIDRIEECKMRELEKVRHLSIAPQNPSVKEVIQVSSIRWKDWSNWNDLRSFLLFGEQEQQAVPPRINISHKIFRLLECLRSLDLSNTDLESPPSDIGNLIHLRYLSFQNSRIRCLPESIGRLFKLQTLNLEGCFQLKELPVGIKLLDNLRHLYLPLSRDREIVMPNGMMQMTDLQTLSLFSVRCEAEGYNIQELGNLLNLKGKMHISGLNNIINPHFAEEAYMQNKGKVQKVTLEWSASDSTSCLDGKCASEVLERLKPHSNTKELCIMGFCGTQFPSWLRNQHLQKLSILVLKGCNHAEKLPPLGQLPSLKHLSIQNMISLKQIGSEFCGFLASSCSTNQCYWSFPKLETLNFKKMYAWEDWDDINNGDFRSLKYLTLNECNALKKVPEFHDSVIIKIKKCLLLKAKEPEPRNQQPNSLETSKTSRVHLILSECGSRFDEFTESYQSGNTKRKCPFTGSSQASTSITVIRNNSSHAQIQKRRRKMKVEKKKAICKVRDTPRDNSIGFS